MIDKFIQEFKNLPVPVGGAVLCTGGYMYWFGEFHITTESTGVFVVSVLLIRVLTFLKMKLAW